MATFACIPMCLADVCWRRRGTTAALSRHSLLTPPKQKLLPRRTKLGRRRRLMPRRQPTGSTLWCSMPRTRIFPLATPWMLPGWVVRAGLVRAVRLAPAAQRQPVAVASLPVALVVEPTRPETSHLRFPMHLSRRLRAPAVLVPANAARGSAPTMPPERIESVVPTPVRMSARPARPMEPRVRQRTWELPIQPAVARRAATPGLAGTAAPASYCPQVPPVERHLA